MKLNLYDIVMEPLITEKLAKATEVASQYGFRVHPQANKKEVKAAVERAFAGWKKSAGVSLDSQSPALTARTPGVAAR